MEQWGLHLEKKEGCVKNPSFFQHDVTFWIVFAVA